MLDRFMLAALAPPIQAVARALATRGVHADTLTWLGFAMGMASCVAIARGAFAWAVALMLAGRVADGLDGAVARLRGPTDRGAFLDIVLDFVFYAGVPLAFAWYDPARNALAAATLLAAFVGTGSSFLALATLAAKRGITNLQYPSKGFYFVGGLTEGTETIACFIAMALWPAHFAILAFVFAALCAATLVTRIVAGLRLLSEESP
jgi:phosphatidylglycerophosphate synthase